jgi:FlaA1/EpsC-like NDP-sugar epimerase
LFKKQLAEGGPLTVTDPEMIRYFMTIPEASQLVLQAGSMGNGGELFLLDMGKPVKIMDLARNMIRLSGYEPDADIKIKITGLRPGEKLYEEPLTEGEDATKTDHEKIFIAKPKQIDPKELGRQIAEFQTCKNGEEVIRVLQEIIPDYHPNHSAVRDNY